MRDPHVDALHYRVEIGEGVSYEDPPPLSDETEAFQLLLKNNVAVFKMHEHHANEESARNVVEQYIKAWEVLIDFKCGSPELRFVFDKADIIDRDPPPVEEEAEVLKVSVAEHLTLSAHLTKHVTRTKYPDPPERFSFSPDVETIYRRYRAYKAGQELLTSMAYMCLTVLELSTGGPRNKIIERYKISNNVVKNLSKLSNKGDQNEARKALKQYVPLTENEKKWFEEVVKALIKRAGEWAFDPQSDLPKLTMKDFPKLDGGESDD